MIAGEAGASTSGTKRKATSEGDEERLEDRLLDLVDSHGQKRAFDSLDDESEAGMDDDSDGMKTPPLPPPEAFAQFEAS